MRKALIAFGLILAACGGAAAPSSTTAASGEAASSTTEALAGTDETTSTTTSTAITNTRARPEGPDAPDFTLALGQGGEFTLSEEQEPVYMVFWAEW